MTCDSSMIRSIHLFQLTESNMLERISRLRKHDGKPFPHSPNSRRQLSDTAMPDSGLEKLFAPDAKTPVHKGMRGERLL